MTSNGDNPRVVALTDCLLRLTADPTAPPKAPPAAAPMEPQVGAAELKQGTAKTEGICTHPRVNGGHCTFCGAAV